ncbi:MAG TPA: hypothetical protein VHU40_19985 [Polyangia bacterium]|jgi:hypothetical protein|nr:hypothetical protein [Polyangia bacterium]
MKNPTDKPELGRGDPVRWREERTPSVVAHGRSLSSDIRKLSRPTELDDLRLAQIRQQILLEAPAPRPAFWFPRQSWLRTAVFALLFLSLGSLATALAARPYVRRLQRALTSLTQSQREAPTAARSAKPRRFRMAVRDSADIELAVAENGAEISVLDGHAELSGPSVAQSVVLSPGQSWQEPAGGAGSAVLPKDQPVAPQEGSQEGSQRGSQDDSLRPAQAAPRAGRVEASETSRPAHVTAAPTARGPAVPAGGEPALRVSSALAAANEPPMPAAPRPVTSPALLRDPTLPIEPPPFRLPPTRPVAATAAPRSVTVASADAPTELGSAQRSGRGRVREPFEGSRLDDSPAEASLLSEALRALRLRGAPTEALAKLDEHRQRFPAGVLAREAALARVEVLLKLGRRAAALEVLDSLALAPRGADRDVRLVRAQLRANAGRCAQATGDFEALLDAEGSDPIAERARAGRSRCTGNRSGESSP